MQRRVRKVRKKRRPFFLSLLNPVFPEDRFARIDRLTDLLGTETF
jgi:hypothetical protein